jgi:hypothetical protein
MTVLKKSFSHRKGAKDAKIFKDEVQDFKSFSKRFVFPAHIIDFLRTLCVFAVKDLFFQWTHEFTRIIKKISENP